MVNYIVNVKIFMDGDEENQKARTIKENYLVPAMSITDAEAIVVEYFKDNTFTFNVEAVKKSNIVDYIKLDSTDE